MTNETRKELRAIRERLNAIAVDVTREDHDLGSQIQHAAWLCTDAVLTSEQADKKAMVA